MGLFYISRKSFLDRQFDFGQLSALVEMLRQWYLAKPLGCQGAEYAFCEARIFGYPRQDSESIRSSLSAKQPAARFDNSDPDELRMTGPTTSIFSPIDLSTWSQVLSEPLIQHACLLLRLTFQGAADTVKEKREGNTTLVLCGAPNSDGLMLKAIWRLGNDESFNAVYRNAAWQDETNLLESFDLYIHNLQIHPNEAADFARGNFGRRFKTLFVTLEFEKKVMRLIRKRSEMPDDRGPLAFARRAGLPLLTAIAAAGAAVFWRNSSLLVLLFGLNAILFAAQPARVIFAKLKKIRRIRTQMRSSLGKSFSSPVEHRQTDLSADKTPTLLKYSAEILSQGARHLCDVAIQTKTTTFDSTKIFTMQHTTIRIGLLRYFQSNLYFPPKPVLHAMTRFEGGRQHATFDHALYRKQSSPLRTARCVLGSAGPQEVLAEHHRHVQRLIASGLVPIPASSTAEEELQRIRKQSEETRQNWLKSPYGWIDALHQAFKVCRREYRVDRPNH